ncbi:MULTISPECIES: hemolysin family protein [Nocardiopsis]|uniref:CBS domain containing protein n=3 Tax=Nocardiopsis TaxID=2013 RepID=D7AYG9_NOCDD|nr:hemolysin family protein [Nocardiopsis dassonvillei]ADH66154.1 CBS domain containing protein [Nocardiopsis dassonvillei subsp. dassonvillei DSM 43111]NKY80946.1 HlyC/CorC family transporter [Nocardiopsis dassonvillei]VEI92174.1 Magnesium and cobalt efflux protein CorC [Nocardiopsis dassonvillei]
MTPSAWPDIAPLTTGEPVEWISAFAVALVLTAVAGFLVAAEVAVTRVMSVGLPEASSGERVAKSGRRWERVSADPTRHLNVLLFLRVVCEVCAVLAAAVGMVFLLGLGWPALGLTAAAMVVVESVLIAIAPRILGRQFSGAFARASAAVVYPVQVVVGPIAQLFVGAGRALTPRAKGDREGPFSTEVELRQLVDLAERGEVIDPEESQMIHSVFKLDDTPVREVMVPRPDIVFTSREADADAVLTLALASGYSRIPVTGEDEDDVVGIVYLKDLVYQLRDRWAAAAGTDDEVPLTAGDVMRQANYVPDTKPIDELLREMQQQRNHVAVAIDEYGGTAGLVTLEDIVEEIVGEITDEYDHEIPPVAWLDADRVRVTARLPLGELDELFPDRDLDVADVETVGGLVAFVLGRVPVGGDRAEYAGLRLTLEGKSSRRSRMTTVLVERLPADAEGAPEEDNDDVRSTEQ